MRHTGGGEEGRGGEWSGGDTFFWWESQGKGDPFFRVEVGAMGRDDSLFMKMMIRGDLDARAPALQKMRAAFDKRLFFEEAMTTVSRGQAGEDGWRISSSSKRYPD